MQMMRLKVLALSATMAIAIGGSASAAVITVSYNDGRIADVDTDSRTVTTILETDLSGNNVELTDIAWDTGGQLWGMSFDNIYKFDLTKTGSSSVTTVGTHGLTANRRNAMDFAADTLYVVEGNNSGDSPGTLHTIDQSNGNATAVGSGPYSPTGDIAIDGNTGFVSSAGTGNGDILYSVTLADGTGSAIGGGLGVSSVFGLDWAGDTLFGVTQNSDLLEIDTTTGMATTLFNFAEDGEERLVYGASIRIAAVPIPAPAGLLLLGLGSLAWFRRRASA